MRTDINKIFLQMKGLGFKRAIGIFVANPQLLSTLISSGANIDAMKKKWMEIRINYARKIYSNYQQQLENKSNFLKVLKEINDIVPYKEINSHFAYHVNLYVIVRTMKPNVIVETGVAGGDSSALLLLGLYDNAKGELYSIDLPLAHFINSKGEEKKWNIPPEKVGSMVPSFLRNRWHLILGDSNYELPKLLNKLKTIDHFHHDDEEIRMKWQFDLVIRYLSENAIFSSDDINLNTAFQDSCTQNNFRFVELWRNRKQCWGVGTKSNLI